MRLKILEISFSAHSKKSTDKILSKNSSSLAPSRLRSLFLECAFDEIFKICCLYCNAKIIELKRKKFLKNILSKTIFDTHNVPLQMLDSKDLIVYIVMSSLIHDLQVAVAERALKIRIE